MRTPETNHMMAPGHFHKIKVQPLAAGAHEHLGSSETQNCEGLIAFSSLHFSSIFWLLCPPVVKTLAGSCFTES